VIKTAAGESEANREQLQAWVGVWRERAVPALLPLVRQVFAEQAEDIVSEQLDAFKARLDKTGVVI